MSNNLKVDQIQEQSALLGPPDSHLKFCKWCNDAGSERVPPALLDWYFRWLAHGALSLALLSPSLLYAIVKIIYYTQVLL